MHISSQFQKETCLVYGLHDMRLIPLTAPEFVAESTNISSILFIYVFFIIQATIQYKNHMNNSHLFILDLIYRIRNCNPKLEI